MLWLAAAGCNILEELDTLTFSSFDNDSFGKTFKCGVIASSFKRNEDNGSDSDEERIKKHSTIQQFVGFKQPQ